MHDKDFKQETDWLSIENDAFHLHINWNKVSCTYFACRKEKSSGLHFIDKHGNLMFRLLFTKQEGLFNPTLLKKFQKNWQYFGKSEGKIND